MVSIVLLLVVVILFGPYFGHPTILLLPMFILFQLLQFCWTCCGVLFGGSLIPFQRFCCSHSSNLRVHFGKKMDSSIVAPTWIIFMRAVPFPLPRTPPPNHRRKKCPHLRQGQHRHSSSGITTNSGGPPNTMGGRETQRLTFTCHRWSR